MPKIVFTGSFQYPTGYASTKRIDHLITYLNKAGYNCQVILFSNNKRSGIYNQTVYKCLYHFDVKILNFLFLPFTLTKFIKLLYANPKKAKKFLYVYSGITFENILIIIFARLWNYKIIVDYVEDFSYHQEKVSFIRRIKIWSNSIFEKKVSKFADFIVVISEYLLVKYKKLVPNDFPILLFPISAQPNNFNKNTYVNKQIKILYSGTYGVKDGVIFLIHAFKKLVDENNEVILILTGEVKEGVKLLLNGYTDKVTMTGYMNDEEYYRQLKNADILVVPRINSTYANAGFPFKLGEYLATGNPVVTTNVTDIKNYLADKESAIIVDAESSESIFQGIKFLIMNPVKAAEIGNSGKIICEKYFNPDINGQLFYNFIEK